MKFFKRTLILLCSALALALSFALAACGSNKHKLTFETFDGSPVPSVEAEAGEDISGKLPGDPVKDGYYFAGWYADESLSGEEVKLPTVMPDGDVTYYAKYEVAVPAKLTLDAGNGGTLEVTQFDVPIGYKLSRFLADKSPAAREGLTFAGWYRNNAPLAEDAVMPAAGIKLTAKYSAAYTVQVYTQNTDGSYGTAETVTGSAVYGEPFDCRGAFEVPEHFTAQVGTDGKLTTQALGIGEVFKVYLARERCYITYLAQAPQEAQVEGTTPLQSALYGTKAVISQCGYTLGGQFRWRFAGWAAEAGGDVAYLPGTETELDGPLTLYAVWEKGYTDVFGGQDVLFPDRAEAGVLRLVRDGLGEEKVGSYESGTDLFSFTENGKTVLDGRLLEGNKFFYFRDTLEGKYNGMEDTDYAAAKLEMKKNGTVVYTENGTDRTGKYSIDPDTGYFYFDDDKDESKDFLYDLVTSTQTDEVVFRRRNTAEEGYYYDETAGIVLYINGLGGLRYYYNEKNVEYEDFSGAPMYYAIGYYEYKSETRLYLAYTQDIISTLKVFTFKTQLKTGVAPKAGENYPEVPSDAKFVGAADMDDGLRGSYIAKREDSDNELYLDGYGNATFGETEGTYELFTWLYSYEEEDGEVIEDYYLIRFTPEEGGDITYFRLDTAYGDYEFDRTITAEEIAAHKGYDVGIFSVKEIFLLNVTYDGFLMIFENGDAELWTQYGITTKGNPVYVLYIEFVSSVVKDANGVYTFRKTQQTTGQYYENEFRFTVDAAKKQLTVILPEQHDTANVATGLTLDYTTRVATYNGKKVDYWYTIGFIDFYTFEIGEDEYLNYWVTTGGRTNFHPVAGDKLFDQYVRPEDEADSYIARLLFTDDGKAYLAFMLSSGMFRFVGIGSVAKQGSGNSEYYTFELSDRLTDMDFSEFSGYERFDFRTYADGTFRIRNEGFSFSNFKPDGYGAYTYTDETGSHVGVIAEVIGEGNGRIVYFVENGTSEQYIFAVDSKTNSLVRVTEDVGRWYEMNDNQLISLNKYLVLNGMGSVYYYEINDLTGEVSVTAGSYTHTSRYAGADEEQPFFEYSITLGGTTTNYLLATYLVQDTTTGQPEQIALYQAQIAHRVGEFDVKGGGHIESIGYPGELAVYTDHRGVEYEGNMYIGDITLAPDDHTFQNGAAGKQVRFWVYENGVATDTDFFFDIETDGTLSLQTMPYGVYALSSDDGVNVNTTLTLDGHGGASFSRGAAPTKGTYAAIAGTEEYRFTSAQRNFTFRLGTVTEDDTVIYTYEQYDETGDLVLFGAADWSVLTLNGFGDAVCINRYGDRLLGDYVLFAAGYGAFESENFNAVFRYTAEGFEFVDHSSYLAAYYAEDFSSVVLTETRVYLNGTSYFYTVEGQNVRIYETGGEHRAATIPLPNGSTYTYSDVTYARYQGGELTFTDSEYDPAQPVSLTFTPDGATFSAAATFDGEEGYTVVVSYVGGKVKATLTYLARAMDSTLEEYPLTLHYGAARTFTVQPLGARDTYKQEIPVKGGVNVNAKNTIMVDNRRVGAYSVALHDVDAGNTLEIAFQEYLDGSGAAFAYAGSVSALKRDLDTHFTYGAVYAVKVTGSDSIEYTVRFYLNEKEKQFLLHSIVVEKAFDVEGVGDVTFIQLWAAGSEYAGAGQKEIVKVSMRETGVETNIYSGALEGNKAALVRQSLNTTAGSYDYEAYVFDITYGADGFATGAVKEGSYGYGEAEQGSEYKVRFLYSGTDSASFEVKYLLTFTAGTDLVDDAVFVKGENGNWTVTTGSSTAGTEDNKTYTVNIKRGSGGFTLTVTEQKQD